MLICKYCSKDASSEYLECNSCGEFVHPKCIKCKLPGGLLGDVFFLYTCGDCNTSGVDYVERDKIAWIDVLLLTLYNLTQTSMDQSCNGYFHSNQHIKKFVNTHWNVLFPHMKTKRKSWKQMVTSTLKSFCPDYFICGSKEFPNNLPGWYKLARPDILPNHALLDRKGKRKKKKTEPDSSKFNYFSEESICCESSGQETDHSGSRLATLNIFCNESSSGNENMYSRSYVKPTASLSEYLFAEDDKTDEIDVEVTDSESSFDIKPKGSPLICAMENIINSDHVDGKNEMDFMIQHKIKKERPADGDVGVQSTKKSEPREENNFFGGGEGGEEEGEEEEEEDDEDDGGDEGEDDEDDDGSDDEDEKPNREKPNFPLSLFSSNGNSNRKPWLKDNFIPSKCVCISESEEAYLRAQVCKRISDSGEASIADIRLYRKLKVRKLRREKNIPVFDLNLVSQKPWSVNAAFEYRILDRYQHQTVLSAVESEKSVSFRTKLLGSAEQYSCFVSPFTQRVLKPFIRRDYESNPLWIKLLRELQTKVNGKKENWVPPVRAPIDYCYVRPQHIPAINSLAQQYFWPGINLSECLQYPDFSCVVLYKKLVVGFAFLVPDVGINEAYISFIFTRPEWRKAGIGTFMLYHLIQTCMGRDITLHVSATNPASLLYQKFGFKVEEFVQDFYDRYLPADSKDCKHAFFLRLSR